MKGLFDRGYRLITRPRIRERYVVEILLPTSGTLLRDDCGRDYERALASYNDWTGPRDRATAAPIVWLDIQSAR